MTLTDKQKELCTESRWDFSDLSALFLNCTLKPGSQLSHTEGLMNVSKSIMEENGVSTEILRPQADAGWIGEAGPGPSYLDENSGSPENDFTQRNTTFLTWDLLHMARILKDKGGIPAHGNQRSQWEAGCRFDHPNPEHR